MVAETESKQWRGKVHFLGGEHSSLLSVPDSLGPLILTCPFSTPFLCSMDPTHSLDSEPSGLLNMSPFSKIVPSHSHSQGPCTWRWSVLCRVSRNVACLSDHGSASPCSPFPGELPEGADS